MDGNVALILDISVDEMMRRWPATISVMIRRRMLCVGCPIGMFHTVTDAASAHGADEADLTTELLGAIGSVSDVK